MVLVVRHTQAQGLLESAHKAQGALCTCLRKKRGAFTHLLFLLKYSLEDLYNHYKQITSKIQKNDIMLN